MNLDPQEFVVHDISRFPFCVFRAQAATPGYAPQWEKEIDALVREGAPFVVVYVSLDADETHEDRKHRAVWLKQNKAALGAACKALISVEPDPERRARVAEQGEMAVKAFGIPHEAVASLDEAAALAARLTDADGAASQVRPV
ncbi:hypothetical protein [Burkholderia ubonensis]|uniref:ATP--cob(I)alamin adenosyltransferase n=1 Tax=Burkholderia ubonensis TaxID=101571 RepID=A0AB74CYC7_9BURK|nr:hypothetical protein [Burkholderia ubonensis]PAJ77783.1 hypothetical protein CJO71_27140 [Burkholderia ubonensis]PAJ86708.1 hypothetical protein CJO70_16565 [Burkholderia ubonensis]PAJ95162.1 hypothetical protein CJO69_07975 [Burkholderia ubonensis]PAJ99622.1 hypothetical protein CJO68_19160 [Burkholderia ubonensis]PAK06909.1 hypothetical protein CJO67_15690 [Burkholderia ubonensis]